MVSGRCRYYLRGDRFALKCPVQTAGGVTFNVRLRRGYSASHMIVVGGPPTKGGLVSMQRALIRSHSPDAPTPSTLNLTGQF